MSQEPTGKSLPCAFGKISWLLPLFACLLAACGSVEEIVAVIPPTQNVTVGVVPAPLTTPRFTPTSSPVVTVVHAAGETAVTPSCTPPSATSTPSPTLTPTPLPTIQPAPTTTHYTLWAILDYDQHQVAVTQTITYLNNTQTTHNTLPLLVEPARSPDAFILQTITGDNGLPLAYEWQDNQLHISLPDPLPPDAHFTLHLSYNLNILAQKSDFGYTPRQTNLGNWYPMIPPYTDEQGWLIHQPAAVGEHLAYAVADYDVYLQVLSTEPLPAVAAPTDGKINAGWQHYQQANRRNFSWSVGQYERISQTINGIQIDGYVFPEDAAVGQDVFTTTAQALTLFSDLFAPYPHNTLTFVEADFPDGMEFDGLYFLDEGLFQRYNQTPREYLIPIAAHETAHQWWQGLVGSNQASEPWLDEALATYSELLFYEYYYPEWVEWWWQFRVNRFEPTGWVDSTIYEFDRFRQYVNTVYLRGVLLLHEMRRQAGDELFFAFLREYAHRGTQKEQMNSVDFWEIWDETTQIDSQEIRLHYFKDRPD